MDRIWNLEDQQAVNKQNNIHLWDVFEYTLICFPFREYHVCMLQMEIEPGTPGSHCHCLEEIFTAHIPIRANMCNSQDVKLLL